MLGRRTPPGERREHVRTPRLGREHRVITGLIRGDDHLRRVGRHARTPVPELQSKFHAVIVERVLTRSVSAIDHPFDTVANPPTSAIVCAMSAEPVEPPRTRSFKDA